MIESSLLHWEQEKDVYLQLYEPYICDDLSFATVGRTGIEARLNREDLKLPLVFQNLPGHGGRTPHAPPLFPSHIHTHTHILSTPTNSTPPPTSPKRR